MTDVEVMIIQALCNINESIQSLATNDLLTQEQARRKEAEEALRFYANDSKWYANHVVDEDYNVIERSDIVRDYFGIDQHCGGKTAREHFKKWECKG